VSLAQFVDAADGTDRTLVVVNRESPRPFQAMLEGLFEDQPVGVTERAVPGEDADAVYLLDGDGEVLATSPLSALQEAILLVNSDLYVTGARDPEELDLPAVLERLDGVSFSLRGYPESNKEKLLLITISRYVEGLALEAGAGKLRSSFQRLSRIEDERGTRAVYERLAATDLDVHVYGVPDWAPASTFGVTMHGGYDADFTGSWFVVHVPEEGGRPAALVAVETEPRLWSGFWTFDADEVASIARYVRREL
jgi:hypothetical protein